MTPAARFAAATDIGPSRPVNEDSLTVGATVVTGTTQITLQGQVTPHEAGPLLAVVDGMGGHRAGGLASSLTARHLAERQALLTEEGTPENAAAALLEDTNRCLFDHMSRAPRTRAMGAAIAGLALLPATTIVFGLGDVAVFQYSSGYLLEVGERHRTPEGRLLQCLGGSAAPVALHPGVSSHSSPPGTRWLVCTDGLTDAVGFDQLQELAGEPDLTTAVSGLLHTALARGTDDNTTLLLVET